MDVCEAYEAGLWVPARYGAQVVPANKRWLTRTQAVIVIDGKRIPGREFDSELDLSARFATVADCEAECRRRNGASS
jgi:hypothetical protein